jgi:hypothetical protein
MADPNTNESKTKTKAGRDSSRLQTRESPLQNPRTTGASQYFDLATAEFAASRFTTSLRTSTLAMTCLIFSFFSPLDFLGNFIST